jgi:uncharacterized protein with ATP-grasp and redox domains
MKLKSRCIPCLLNRILYEADLEDADETTKKLIIQKSARRLLTAYEQNLPSAVAATDVHGMVYEMLGSQDPYRMLKQRSNEMALRLLPQAEDFIAQSDDRLTAAVTCAIVGNAIDFGIEGSASSPEALETTFINEVKQGLQHNDLKAARAYLGGSVIFFTDNCGEIIFDKLVCQELKADGVSVTLVVKEQPILTDATLADARKLGFDGVVDDIVTTGAFAVGVDFRQLPSAVLHKLNSASLIICKGMANYESFSETSYRPIAYLLKVKCQSIADSIGLPLNAHAVKLVV